MKTKFKDKKGDAQTIGIDVASIALSNMDVISQTHDKPKVTKKEAK